MLELFKQRRSIRMYKDQPIEQEKIKMLIQAQLLAPTSMNKKPIELIVIEDKETILKLEECKNKGTIGLKTAPLAVVVIGDGTKSDVWIEDASIAATFIQLEAEKMGLGSCWIQMRNREGIAGDSENMVRRLLNIPEHYGVLCVLTIGYKNEEKKGYQEPDIAQEGIHYNRF